MIRGFTGEWKLNLAQSSSQYELLKTMGRKPWETSVIDRASEEFCLFHFRKLLPDQTSVNYFEKFVVIYLDSQVLRFLSAILPIEFDKVRYHHKFTANGKEKHHPDDEKRFGECTSRTTWENRQGQEGFCIRWYIKTGILKVWHYINDQNQLISELEMCRSDGGVAKARKVYERQAIKEEHKALLNAAAYKSDLVGSIDGD